MAKHFGRWFRFYDAALDDPKVQRLNDRHFRAWINLLCLANRHGGTIKQSFEDIGFALRMSSGHVRDIIQVLISAGLIDQQNSGLSPHNWNERQFKADVSTERVKRFRKRRETVSETAPDTETETDTETEKKKDAATQTANPPSTTPLDFKKELWTRGVSFLKTHGVEDRDARAIIGRWRKSHGDLEVLNALAAAEGGSVSDPIPYVTATLKGKGKPNGSSGQHGELTGPAAVFVANIARARSEQG